MSSTHPMTQRPFLQAREIMTLAVGDFVDLYIALQEPGRPEAPPAEHRAQVCKITADTVEFTLTRGNAGDVVELPFAAVVAVCSKVEPGDASTLH